MRNVPSRKTAWYHSPFISDFVLQLEEDVLLLGGPFLIFDVVSQVIMISRWFENYLYLHCLPFRPMILNSSCMILDICDHLMMPLTSTNSFNILSYSALHTFLYGIIIIIDYQFIKHLQSIISLKMQNPYHIHASNYLSILSSRNH